MKLKDLNFNILCCSDFHNSICKEKIENAIKNTESDIIVTLGDISVNDLKIIKTVADTKNTPVIGVGGNHDVPNMLPLARIEDLHGKTKNISGITFAGIGGSLKYKSSNNMFLSQKRSIDIAKELSKADIFITHDKAYKGIFADMENEYAKDPHEGLIGIKYYIKNNKPLLHIHGHLHKHETYKEYKTTGICTYGIELIKIKDGKISKEII